MLQLLLQVQNAVSNVSALVLAGLALNLRSFLACLFQCQYFQRRSCSRARYLDAPRVPYKVTPLSHEFKHEKKKTLSSLSLISSFIIITKRSEGICIRVGVALPNAMYTKKSNNDDDTTRIKRNICTPFE